MSDLVLTNTDFYSVSDAYTELYYQMPKWLFKPPYKDLSNNARVAYTLLRDRNEISKRNKWYDEKGRLYFIYTTDELTDILGLSKPTVIKVKGDLEKAGLIYQEKHIFNYKTRKKLPNRIFKYKLKIKTKKFEDL